MNSPRLRWNFCSALIPVLIVLMFASPARSAVVLSRQDAVNVLVSELGLSGARLAWCPYADYGSGPGFEGVLPIGTTVRPFLVGGQPFPGNVASLTNPMYLFFVDDEPLARFVHAVRYVYVDATVASPSLAAGTIVIHAQGWWPVIQRPEQASEEIFGELTRYSAFPGGYANVDGLVFGQIPVMDAEPISFAPASLLPTSIQAEPNACVIIATGTTAGRPHSAERGMSNTADSLKAELMARGVPAGRIQDKRNASKDDLRAAVAALCAVSPACDKIYVFLLSHGLKKSITLKGASVSADTLCKVVAPLGQKSVPVCFYIGACYSGSLVSTLRPKFPLGVIVTDAGPDSQSWSGGVVTDSNGGTINTQDLFSYLFLRCWRSAAADTDGVSGVSWPEAFAWVCKNNNSKLYVGTTLWDVKSRMPTLNGLPTKFERWQGPVSGAWYSDLWTDVNKDGKFDLCTWSRDDDCDGNSEVTYFNRDENQDGKQEEVVCERDSTDNGIPETRYTFMDLNKDGTTDSIRCESFNGSTWTQTAMIPRRIGNFNISPSSGGRGGEQAIQITGIGTTWADPGIRVFVGSDCRNVILNNPSLVSAITKGYLVGPRNAIVADFNIGSASYGFVEKTDAFMYTDEIFVDSVDPASGPCNTARTVTIHGTAFSSSAQVRVGGIPVSSTWINGTTMTAMVPSSFCATVEGVTVDNPGNGEATLEDAYEYLPAADQTPPSITCPGNITLAAGDDGLARTSPSFLATATDNAGSPIVYRNALGALPVGTHPVQFEAIDGSGNRATCTATVQVTVPDPGPARRTDSIWARQTTDPITLDGVLDEAAWAKAESLIVRYGEENGIPGSGWKFEAGLAPGDSTYAVLKLLVRSNQMFLGAEVRDKSVGGSVNFNRFDGFLMAIKDRANANSPKPPDEYFYSWWYPGTSDPQPTGRSPGFIGRWGNMPPTLPRSPQQIAAWDATTVVHGLSNSDSGMDTGYTVEMKFDLTVEGYDVTVAEGDVVEWNISIYDCDWFWPIDISRFSSNRCWIQSPWGNTNWYDEIRVHSKPAVTVNSGPVPYIQPDVIIPSASSYATPAIDGQLTEPVWAALPLTHIKYVVPFSGDESVRAAYPGIGPYVSGQLQLVVNGGLAPVVDAGDADFKMFLKGTNLYFGFDVRDQYVQHRPEYDRYDGFVVTINDRLEKTEDQTLKTRNLTFQVAENGTATPHDDLSSLVQAGYAQVALALKPGTTVDTLGLSNDMGYTAEMSLDLTGLGYPADLGDRIFFVGVSLLDGDSRSPATNSYGTRTWWFREVDLYCCPAWTLLSSAPVSDGDPAPRPPSGYNLLGAFPNPADRQTIRYALIRPSLVDLQVFDIQGRLIEKRLLGVQPEGVRELPYDGRWLAEGVYLFQIIIMDPSDGSVRAVLPGRMVVTH